MWAQVEVGVLVVVEHRPESPSWSSSGERAWLGIEGDDTEKEIREREDVLCGPRNAWQMHDADHARSIDARRMQDVRSPG